MGKAIKSIPNFKNESEERAFWEGQDSTASVDWSKAKCAVLPNLKPTTMFIRPPVKQAQPN